MARIGEVTTQLLEENEQLKKALFETKHRLDEKANDWKVGKAMLDDCRVRLEQTTEEYRGLETRYWRAVEEKETVEKNAKEDFRKLQDLVARKSRELNEVQSKYLSFVDFDLEQKKIENKLELKYGKEIEEKQRVVDALNRTVNDLIRDGEIAKARLANSQKDHEEAMRLLRDAHKKQVDILLAEISEHQNIKVFNDYRDKYNEAKVKKEEAEKKLELLDAELSSVRGELQTIKVRFNQTVVDDAREADKLRSEVWAQKNEKEKLGYRNESLEKENYELKEKFNDYEKKITQLSNEVMEGNKALHYKDKEFEDLNRRLTQAEDDFQQKVRTSKNTVDEQLHSVKMVHANDLKNQQDEIRMMRDKVAKLEDRLKATLHSDQNKDKLVMDTERKYAELSDKINSVTNLMKIEKDNNDRLCLENEELKRKLHKEEARCRKAQEEIKEFEIEFTVHREKNEETKRTLVEEKDKLLKRERPLNSEEDQFKINILSKKVADLKEKLKVASDRLVKSISEKVILLQKLRDAGIDCNEPSKQIKRQEIYVEEIAEKNQNDYPQQSGCPVHQGNHHHHQHVHHATIPAHYPLPQGGHFATEAVQYGQPEPYLSHEAKIVHPMASFETTPFTSAGFHTGDKFLVDERTYHANVADLTEDELQMKIRHLLTQKETFFANA